MKSPEQGAIHVTHLTPHKDDPQNLVEGEIVIGGVLSDFEVFEIIERLDALGLDPQADEIRAAMEDVRDVRTKDAIREAKEGQSTT